MISSMMDENGMYEEFIEEPQSEKIIRELEEAAENYKDLYLRAKAELDNFRKRTIKEKSELIKTAAEDTILKILPVLDDLDLAEKEIPGSLNSGESLKACLDGFSAITKKLKDNLATLGLEKFDPTGEMFNPDFHEAVVLSEEGPEVSGTVVGCIQPGYILGGKIIRFAKVIVKR